MATVGESSSTNKRKRNGLRKLPEEEGKSEKKYNCKYHQTWEKDYPFMCRSHKVDEYAKFNSCRIDISVAREGKDDVTKHITSENHKKSIAAEKRNQAITSFMVKGPKESDKLI